MKRPSPRQPGVGLDRVDLRAQAVDDTSVSPRSDEAGRRAAASGDDRVGVEVDLEAQREVEDRLVPCVALRFPEIGDVELDRHSVHR